MNYIAFIKHMFIYGHWGFFTLRLISTSEDLHCGKQKVQNVCLQGLSCV